MTKEALLKLLSQVNAILSDSHVVYTSGKHGRAYVNKDAIYPHTDLTSQLCRQIAEHFAHHPVDVVVAPALGGVLLAQWVAHHLSHLQNKKILALYAEKTSDGGFELGRGYAELCRSKNVLILEDIVNTGGSLKKVIHTVRALPAHIIGAACLCNRGQITCEDLENIPELYSLIELNLQAWEAEHCPLCQEGVAIHTGVGKGREFMKSRKPEFPKPHELS